MCEPKAWAGDCCSATWAQGMLQGACLSTARCSGLNALPSPPPPPPETPQGGAHHHTISGLAVALKMANTPEFKQYQQQVGAGWAG